MKRILIITTMLSLIIFLQSDKSSAQEINLCLNYADEYVVIVDTKDDCLEDERWMSVKGSQEIEDKKKYTPLLEITPNQDCNTEGVVRKIGFDQDNDGALDQNEIFSTGSDCKIETEEES